MKRRLNNNWALCCLGLMVVALTSCLDTPSKPIHDNPFDPLNPDTHGDPYNLRASLEDAGVLLEWDAVDWQPLTGYSIHRSYNFGQFRPLQQVGRTTLMYLDRNVQDGRCYQYLVVAMDIEGDGGGNPTGLRRAEINTLPRIIIENDSAEFTPSRAVTLHIEAYGARRMQLANTPDFAEVDWEAFVATKPWQLTTGAGVKTVNLRVIYANGDTSDAVADIIQTAAPDAPQIVIAHDSTYTSTRNVELTISAPGATEMQLSNEPFTGDEEWIDFAESVDWELSAGAGTKIVYLKVRDEFLIESEASDQIEPEEITAGIEITLDSTYINHTNVPLAFTTTGALEMKVSNTSDPLDAVWFECADSLTWNLSPGDGWKRVYAWFRNDFFTEDVVSDSIGLDTQAEIISADWVGTRNGVLGRSDTITFSLQTDGDAFGEETNGIAYVSITDWDIIPLNEEGSGLYSISLSLWDKPSIEDANVIFYFSDRAGNTAFPFSQQQNINFKFFSIFKDSRAHSDQVSSVKFSSDGQFLVSGSHDCTIIVWDTEDLSVRRTITQRPVPVLSIDISPDGETIASTFGQEVKLWRLVDGQNVRTLTGHESSVSCLGFIDNQTIASGSGDYTVRIWRITNGSLVRTLNEQFGNVIYSIAISPDGLYLSSGSSNFLKLWQLSNGQQIRRIDCQGISSLSHSPDGTMIAGSNDSSVSIWDTSNGELIRELLGHSSRVTSVAFSPDGRFVAGGSTDHTIILWRVSDGLVMNILTGHENAINSVAFSTDGNLLASASADRTVKLWR